jgi:hypothetical protein
MPWATGPTSRTKLRAQRTWIRTADAANEITSITTWATPVYDAAGNMTTIPKPNALTGGYTATYDAWNVSAPRTAGARSLAERTPSVSPGIRAWWRRHVGK